MATSLLLLYWNAKRFRARSRPAILRVFKGDESSTEVLLEAGSLRWLRPASLLIEGTLGFEARVAKVRDRSFGVAILPRYSGTFKATAATLGGLDCLGAFRSNRPIPFELTVECLPIALLQPKEPLRFSPLRVGENPVGMKGTGQELYALEDYHPDADPKDILWKRVARAEDDSVPLRVRESNLRASVTVGFELTWETREQGAKRVDLGLEALALIGRVLLTAGTELEVAYRREGSTLKSRAREELELADLIIDVSNLTPGSEIADRGAKYDLLITTEEGEGALDPRKGIPTLVISEDPNVASIPRDAFVFTGSEDLSLLTLRVLDR